MEFEDYNYEQYNPYILVEKGGVQGKYRKHNQLLKEDVKLEPEKLEKMSENFYEFT